MSYYSRKEANDSVYSWSQISLSRCDINGNGYTIYGLYGRSIFNELTSACKIRNLNLKNCYCNAGALYANLCVHAHSSSFEKISVYGVACNGANPMVYRAEASNFNNCVNYARICKAPSGRYIGGICGYLQGNCKVNYSTNYGEVKGTSVGGISGLLYNSQINNCKNYGKVSSSGGAICYMMRENSLVSYCDNYGNVGTMVAEMTRDGTVRNCKNNGKMSGSLVYNLGSNAMIFECENNSPTKCNSGIVRYCHGKVAQCRNNSDCDNGFIETLYEEAIILNCESNGNFSYYFGQDLRRGALIKNCIVRGNASNTKGIANKNSATIEGLVFIGYINNTQNNQFYGSDFSVFFVKWKTGYIGLKTFEDCGVYMYSIPSENYLISKGFAKLG